MPGWLPASRRDTHFRHGMGHVAWLLIVALLASMSGCGGCRNETPQERAERLAAEEEERREQEAEARERREKQADFVVDAPVTKPSDTELQISRAKRGHWMTVTQQMKANYRDWGGETTLRVVDKSGRPVPVDGTPFVLSTQRPVQLAKGRPRQVENLFFVPPAERAASVQCTLRERNYGAVVGGLPKGAPLSMMPSYEYFFVVLSKQPERYSFLKSLNGVRVPQDSLETSDDLLHYQVLLPDINRQVPLPDNPLCWTTIAHVLWDEVDPAELDRARRQALVDWLHWGGQLIINGPDSLQLLEGSFLEPYLPATDAGAAELTEADIRQLAEFWTNKPRAGRSQQPPKPLQMTRNWSGIELDLADDVEADRGLSAATGGLLVERRVGRGRIVVSRMQLAERDLLTWSPHYDDLFNAGILRRPPRQWSTGDLTSGFNTLHGEWAGKSQHIRDARYVTHLRYFSRDVHHDPEATNWRLVEPEPVEQQIPPVGGGFGGSSGAALREPPTLQPPEVPGGIGAWNNFNATSNAAREALRKAAGVRVPDSSFVVTCLAVYLVVLVPLNWFFFKALGRVEYAWIAAPVIAIAGTAVVVQQAQLDIGFVRAQTEVGLLEIQGDYPRAHLSRYTALYTSLSTTYDVTFEEPTTIAAPFPTRSDYQMLTGQSPSEVRLVQSGDVQLAGMPVSSATTDMLHSEQMFQLDGPLVYRPAGRHQWQVINRSQLRLRSVAVVRREDQGAGPRMLGAWVGELGPNDSATVTFAPLPDVPDAAFARRRLAELESRSDPLDLEPMFALALDATHINSGEVRLVGRVDAILPGVTVEPSAAQTRGATLVVAHLQRAPLPLPVPDVNSPRDVIAANSRPLGVLPGDAFDDEIDSPP